MDYSDNISSIFKSLRDSKGYVVLEEAYLYKYTNEELDDLMDTMGELSRKARSQPSTLTSSIKFTK
jgi:hypothetical protein